MGIAARPIPKPNPGAGNRWGVNGDSDPSGADVRSGEIGAKRSGDIRDVPDTCVTPPE